MTPCMKFPHCPNAPAEVTLQDVATQAGLKTLDVLDRECSQQVLLRLAKYFVDWQLTGFHLELTEAEITAVDEDCRTAEQKRAGMLRKWKEKFAFKATYRVLIEALLSCGKASDAVNACKTIAPNVEVPTKVQTQNMTFSSSISDEDFFKWLRSKGVNDKDCKTLSDSGIAPSGFPLCGVEDFDDIGLTKIGKKRVLEAFTEIKAQCHDQQSSEEDHSQQQALATMAPVPAAEKQSKHACGSTSATHLSDSDHSWIYEKLAPRAAKWRDIGRELGFKQGEMDIIQSNPMLLTQSPPQSWLSEMLSQWLQWAPGDGRGSTGFATRESLQAALLKANLGQLAQQFIRPVQ